MQQTIASPVRRTSRSIASYAVSAALHLAVLTPLLLHPPVHTAKVLLYPGTADGHNLMLSYLPGRAPKPAVAPPPKEKPLTVKAQLAVKPPVPVKAEATSTNRNSPPSDHPNAASGADALGSGNINIALAKYFPRPHPDLSTMADGSRGDVVVDVTIDETGRIADMKLVQGLGRAIDETVLATVRQWTFTPANKDGQPIASEQELHFHYEKA